MNPEANGTDHASVAFHPPILLAVSLGIGFFLKWIAPLSFLPKSASAMIGPAAIVLSLGIFVWTVYTMLRNDASIPTHTPTEAIVVRGPFRFSRNPIYLAMVFLQLGVGVWANSLWFLVLAAVSVALLTWGVISREEQYLERKFNGEYVSYKSRVRRWI